MLLDRFVVELGSKLMEKDTAVLEKEIEVSKFFTFDPNHVDHNEMLALGMAPNIARRVNKYRDAGGVFKKKADLLKIYGLDSALYTRLEPFIEIAQRASGPAHPVKIQKRNVEEKVVLQDLNEADTTDLKKIHGIGNVLSLRIVRYRALLGGFISLQQLEDVYGLKPEVMDDLKERYFIAEEFEPSKINVNQDNYDKLAYHPYISKNQARSILAFRMQHGAFSDLNDLLEIDLLDKETFAKVSPYLQLGSKTSAGN